MLPHGLPHLLYTFAVSASALIAHKDAPELLRREMRRLVRKLRRDLPKKARREIEAAEAEAAIKAAAYLRRSDRN